MLSASNGTDRNGITGIFPGDSNSNFNCLHDVTVCHDQPQMTAAAEGMILGHIGGTVGVPLQELGSHSILKGIVEAGPQVTVGTVFCSPQIISDTVRCPTAYTTAPDSSEFGSFSSIYTTETLGMTLTPCGAFYSNQHPSYGSGMLHTLDPQFNSYSSVLQSMGTHAAHAQIPNSPYRNAAAIEQYSLLSVAQSSSHDQEELKYRRDQQDLDIQRRYSTGVLKDEKQHFSIPSTFSDTSRISFSSSSHEVPSHKHELPASVQDLYKMPPGREGSLKHRFLRPSNSSCAATIPQHSAIINMKEPFLKRTKTDQSEAVKDSEWWPVCKKAESDSLGSESSAHLQYPQHFMKGSIIQLGNGKLKRVEDLETDDFTVSADVSNDLKIDSSTVVNIEENEALGTAALGFVVGEHKVKVSVEATVEHPFFVFGQGWSSCEPSWTLKRYGLVCHKLTVGDVCISLTHKEVQVQEAEISKQQKEQGRLDGHAMFDRDTRSESSSQHSPDQSKVNLLDTLKAQGCKVEVLHVDLNQDIGNQAHP